MPSGERTSRTNVRWSPVRRQATQVRCGTCRTRAAPLPLGAGPLVVVLVRTILVFHEVSVLAVQGGLDLLFVELTDVDAATRARLGATSAATCRRNGRASAARLRARATRPTGATARSTLVLVLVHLKLADLLEDEDGSDEDDY